jgi:hypothetical protein
VLGGCEANDQIEHYQAPKPPKFRMLGAIVPHGERFWFFKVSGPIDVVGECKKEVDAFFDSVTFDGDKPKWQVPGGWRQEEGDAMRQATFLLGPQDEPLELTVTSFPKPEKMGADELLLANVNRWRRQMGLGDLDKAEQLEATAPKKEINGIVRHTVDLVGPKPGKTRRMPMMPPMEPPPVPDQPPPERGEGEVPTYRVPAGWEEEPTPRGGLRFATFRVRGRDQNAQVTIVALGAQAGSLEQNVNRWRDQLGLPPVGPDQLASLVRTVSVDGRDVPLVTLPGSRPDAQGTLAATFNRDDRTWFFKMTGPTDLLAREKDNFENFVRSVRFK